MIGEILDLDLDHVEDLCLLQDGRVLGGGERGQIYVIDVQLGSVERVGSIGARALGVALDEVGSAYVCSPGHGAVMSFRDGVTTLISRGASDAPMLHPNSIAMTSAGAYVSDSGRWGWTDGRIYFHPINGDTRVVGEGFGRFPNGLAVAIDGAHLWIVESEFGVVRAAIGKDGSLGAREEIAALPGFVPDGVTVTSEGSVIVSCFQPNALLLVDERGGVDVIATDRFGAELLLPTNATFIGEQLEALIVANLGGRHLTVIETGLSGTPVLAGPQLEPNRSTVYAS